MVRLLGALAILPEYLSSILRSHRVLPPLGEPLPSLTSMSTRHAHPPLTYIAGKTSRLIKIKRTSALYTTQTS